MKNFKNAFEDSQELCNIVNDSSNGGHSGPIIFKPEKNLEFFRQKNGP